MSHQRGAGFNFRSPGGDLSLSVSVSRFALPAFMPINRAEGATTQMQIEANRALSRCVLITACTSACGNGELGGCARRGGHHGTEPGGRWHQWRRGTMVARARRQGGTTGVAGTRRAGLPGAEAGWSGPAAGAAGTTVSRGRAAGGGGRGGSAGTGGSSGSGELWSAPRSPSPATKLQAYSDRQGPLSCAVRCSIHIGALTLGWAATAPPDGRAHGDSIAAAQGHAVRLPVYPNMSYNGGAAVAVPGRHRSRLLGRDDAAERVGLRHGGVLRPAIGLRAEQEPVCYYLLPPDSQRASRSAAADAVDVLDRTRPVRQLHGTSFTKRSNKSYHTVFGVVDDV